MRIIMDVWTSDELYSGCEECAVVEISEELHNKLKEREAAFKATCDLDEDAYEAYFWDGFCEFYGYDVLEAANLEHGRVVDEYEVLPAHVDLSQYEACRTDCDQMILRRRAVGQQAEQNGPYIEIAWAANPRHTGVTVQTRGVPLDELLRMPTEPSVANTG